MTALILIADDVPANIKLLEARLASEYYDVITAKDGLEALSQAKQHKPDVILLDVMMPGMDGFETCRKLKSDPDLSHIPVIMMTALSEKSDRLKGLEYGADDFLPKPINDVVLFARIKMLLDASQNKNASIEPRLTKLGQDGVVTIISVEQSHRPNDYLVSTLYRANLSLFQTMVLVMPKGTPRYRIERKTMDEAITEHVDTVNMVVKMPERLWDGTKPYQDTLMDEWQQSGQTANINNDQLNWTTTANIDTLRAAGLSVTVQHSKKRLVIMWNPAEHTDEENLRWCWLRAVEWGGFPAFLSQLFAPILFMFLSWKSVIVGIVIANIIWSLFRYRFVSVPIAGFVAAIVSFLKWFISLSAAIYLLIHDQTIAVALALFWPLIVGFLAAIPPTRIGRLQKLFMAALGYK